MKSYHFMFLAVISLAAIVLAGCSKTVPLKGTVVLSDDGSPVTNGTVCFTDGKNMSRGTINEDGSFEMGFVGMKDGIVPGTYTIYFFGVGSVDSGEKMIVYDTAGNPQEIAAMSSRIPLIDPKYENPATSGLQAEVTKKTKTMEIKVDRYVPNQQRSR